MEPSLSSFKAALIGHIGHKPTTRRPHGQLKPTRGAQPLPPIDFSELRRRIAITDVLTLLRFEPTKSQGSRVRGSCPIHKPRHVRQRDFSVNLDTNRFRCFGCGKGVNQLDLWGITQELPLYSAAIDLCRRLRIE